MKWILFSWVIASSLMTPINSCDEEDCPHVKKWQYYRK